MIDKRFFVYYEPNGAHSLADGEMEDHLNKRIDIVNSTEQRVFVFVSNFSYIDEVRMAISQGRLSHEIVEFHFNGIVISSDQDGNLDKWPKGFGDRTSKILCAIVQNRIERKIK
jgi:hypothetical protein